jgi:hypothetical protein
MVLDARVIGKHCAEQCGVILMFRGHCWIGFAGLQNRDMHFKRLLGYLCPITVARAALRPNIGQRKDGHRCRTTQAARSSWI